MARLICGWDDGNPYSEATSALHLYAGWAAVNIPHVGRIERFGPCTCIAVVNGSVPLAVVVYHNSDDQSRALEMSMAASDPRWATRGTIRACLHYPFVQLKCGVVICRVPRNVRRTKRFLSGIGFSNCGTIPHGFGDQDCSIYCLSAETAFERWLGPHKMKEAA